MHSGLKEFIAQYASLPPEEMDAVVGKFKSKVIKKNNFLLRPGEICRDFVFVEKGCVRLYYVNDGVEISVWFAFQQSSAIEIHSFVSEQPSGYYLQAVENSEVLYLPKKELNQLCAAYHKMQEMMRNFWEDVALNLISRFTSLQTDSAEKRSRFITQSILINYTINILYL